METRILHPYNPCGPLRCVVGDPVSHSLSPRLHAAMAEALGEDVLYLAFRVPSGGLPAFLSAAHTLPVQGFNLTMPLKREILPYLSETSPAAAGCHSCNTVRVGEDGRLYGTSTDGAGFGRALQLLDMDFRGQRVTILGAGGAAASIAFAARDGGAEVRVLNRTLAHAREICDGQKHMQALPLQSAEEILAETDLVVNTTPLGMTAAAADDAFSFLRALPAHACAADCIYAPADTPFMAAARKYGHRAINGIGMLVYQAIYACAFFRNEEFSPETVTRLGEKLLSLFAADPFGR